METLTRFGFTITAKKLICGTLFVVCLSFQETTRMNYLRDYYERALQEFGTSDDGTHVY